jgi:pimeloyl-ACP methyl ester carboxylesterase
VDRSVVHGGNLDGVLYYSRRTSATAKMPVVIWLHPYTYSTGYSRLPIVPILPEHEGPYMTGTYSLSAAGYLGTDFKTDLLVRDGFAIFAYDMIGFGSRIPEVQRFYERFPHWSLMGKMVDDVQTAVDVLSANERIDPHRIYVMGYSLGGTVALLAAALDDRIAGAAVVCGYTPLRAETPAKGTGELDNLAFIHGLIPRLGFFKGYESRVPWDFSDALSLVAPRPLMIVAPQFDQEASVDDVKHSVDDARRVYEMLNTEERSAVAYDYNWSGIWRSGVSRAVHLRSLELYTPPEYNHFDNAMQSVVYHWMQIKLIGQFSSRMRNLPEP